MIRYIDFGPDDNMVKWAKSEIIDMVQYEKFVQVAKHDTVLDLGASVGPFTLSIMDACPDRVVCVEPSVPDDPAGPEDPDDPALPEEPADPLEPSVLVPGIYHSPFRCVKTDPQKNSFQSALPARKPRL